MARRKSCLLKAPTCELQKINQVLSVDNTTCYKSKPSSSKHDRVVDTNGSRSAPWDDLFGGLISVAVLLYPHNPIPLIFELSEPLDSFKHRPGFPLRSRFLPSLLTKVALNGTAPDNMFLLRFRW